MSLDDQNILIVFRGIFKRLSEFRRTSSLGRSKIVCSLSAGNISNFGLRIIS